MSLNIKTHPSTKSIEFIDGVAKHNLTENKLIRRTINLTLAIFKAHCFRERYFHLAVERTKKIKASSMGICWRWKHFAADEWNKIRFPYNLNIYLSNNQQRYKNYNTDWRRQQTMMARAQIIDQPLEASFQLLYLAG